MLFGKFRKVEGNSKRMEFRCRNPYVFPGEPMAIVFNSGKDDDYFNEEVWEQLYDFKSEPIPYEKGKKIAVRVVSQFGEESTKVLEM